MNLLAVDGTLVIVGRTVGEHQPRRHVAHRRPPQHRRLRQRRHPDTQEMLDFCAEHGILPETELIAASYINEAYERVLSSDVRYRFVIDAKTFA